MVPSRNSKGCVLECCSRSSSHCFACLFRGALQGCVLRHVSRLSPCILHSIWVYGSNSQGEAPRRKNSENIDFEFLMPQISAGMEVKNNLPGKKCWASNVIGKTWLKPHLYNIIDCGQGACRIHPSAMAVVPSPRYKAAEARRTRKNSPVTSCLSSKHGRCDWGWMVLDEIRAWKNIIQLGSLRLEAHRMRMKVVAG